VKRRKARIMKIKKTELTLKETSKVKTDLEFLSKFLKKCRKEKLRVVVSGGYALDGILGEITRPHRDLDLVVYGKKDRKTTAKILTRLVSEICPECGLIGEKENRFYSNLDFEKENFFLNLYFVETVNDPFGNINVIRLKTGKELTNSEKRFPSPMKAKLGGLFFESQNPNLSLADILFKRKKERKFKKHVQDIYNLEQVTDKRKVEYILSKY